MTTSLWQRENWITKLMTTTTTHPYLTFFSSVPLRYISSITWSINITFLIASIQIHLCLHLVLIVPINYDPITFSNWHTYLSTLYIFKPSQLILHHSILNRNNLFLWMHSFLMISLSILLLIYLSILISITLLFCTCCFLITQHSKP